MRNRRIIVCIALCCVFLALFVSSRPANCQDYVAYSLKINADGSATWTATKFSDINAPIDTWTNFEDRIFNLLTEAVNITHRAMDIDGNSLQINTNISAGSKITEYSFLWLNFSIKQANDLVFGDVFQINDFFSQLYGNGALQVTYPLNLTVKSISPEPYQREDSSQSFVWARTQDLTNGKTSITLTSAPQTGATSWLTIAIAGAVSAAVIVSLATLYMFKRRKGGETAVVASPLLESGEDKIVKLLKVSGGSLRQSDIAELCGFSKAKTSQLLTALESRGILARYKNGRDKIVTLKGKSEK